jgi:Peptidase S24-like
MREKRTSVFSFSFMRNSTEEPAMTMSQQETPQATIVAALFIQAVREGQSLWFRVASKSMLPLMRLDDSIYIIPAKASEIRVGEIAAFETSGGLTIHRIVRIDKTSQKTEIEQTGESLRLLQMSDVELLPSWIKETAVVGKVVSIRRQRQQGQREQKPENRQKRQVNLRHPIAQWCGTVTARVRYKLYIINGKRLLKLLLRVCSRLSIRIGNACIWLWCASSVTQE